METKPIPFAPQYTISDSGVVIKTEQNRKISQFRLANQVGVNLKVGNKFKLFYIHRLVMEAFGPPKPFPKAIIRHLDDNPLNNNISNLAWGDQHDNFLDRLSNSLKNETDLPTKLQISDILNIQKMFEDKVRVSEIAKFYNVSPIYIYKIREGNSWKLITKGESYHTHTPT